MNPLLAVDAAVKKTSLPAPGHEGTEVAAIPEAYSRAEGFGLDLNGFAGARGPRFGPNANCGDPQSDPITYPFTFYGGDVVFEEPTLGNRTIDFNTEGLAHIGLLPEVIQDILGDGVSKEELEPLFRSAEGYIRMWEKAEARAEALAP